MNTKLMKTAKKEARKFFHGDIMGAKSNLQPIAKLFPPHRLGNWNNGKIVGVPLCILLRNQSGLRFTGKISE